MHNKIEYVIYNKDVSYLEGNIHFIHMGKHFVYFCIYFNVNIVIFWDTFPSIDYKIIPFINEFILAAYKMYDS